MTMALPLRMPRGVAVVSAVVALALVTGLGWAGPHATAAGAEPPTDAPDEYAELQRQIADAHRWDQARLARETARREALILPDDRSPVDIVWRRTRALLDHLQHHHPTLNLHTESSALEALGPEVARARSLVPPSDPAALRGLFDRLARLRRRIAFRNPLLDFDAIVFLKHDRQARGEVHMVDQYLGFNAARAGGVYVLDRPFSDHPVVRSLLAGRPIVHGRLRGQQLEDRGGFIALDLDFDGRSLLFAYTEAAWDLPDGVTWDPKYWTAADRGPVGRPQSPAHYFFRPESCYHVFRMNLEGGGPVQLTDGPWNDVDPCFLPGGRIAFISSRSGGQCRCGARPLPSSTLHAMLADGTDIQQLSWHDTNEWQPSVDQDGMLVYTRWDYVDRDSDVAHHLWRCYPDGRDPRSPHGNYPDRRESRPWMEMSIRAIPGSSRYLAVAAPHHGEAYGSLVQIDPALPDDRATRQVRRLTPEVHFPESEQAPGVPHAGAGKHAPRGEVYGTPWPLDEDFVLCVYSPSGTRHALYLVDSFGNRELLFRDPKLGCLDPIPLKPRPRPPVLPVGTRQALADRAGLPVPGTGTVAVMNVYDSRLSWPANTRITELRVVNVFPKDNAIQDVPNIGAAAQSLGRGVLGTVPVEPDGSAHFQMPAGVPVYFQLLDADGRMVQTMRSATYVHPGERLVCAGCHETRQQAPGPPAPGTPMALRRPPSELRPEPSGSYPLTFPRLVQPVLDAHCVSCHEREPKSPSLRGDRFAASGRSVAFESLRPFAWGRSGGNGTALKERQYSVPGQEGARTSRLHALLQAGHYDVRLPPDARRRLDLWLDCNSNFYGAYHDAERQARGEVVRPVWGTPPWIDFATLVR